MQAFLLPKKALQVSVQHDCLVKVLDKEPTERGDEGGALVEICMTTITSEKLVYHSFEKVNMVAGFIDQIGTVLKILEENRENSGPIGLPRDHIVLSIQPLKNGSYETCAYVDAFFFRPKDEERFRGLELVNLADMAGAAKVQANDLVNGVFKDLFYGDE